MRAKTVNENLNRRVRAYEKTQNDIENMSFSSMFNDEAEGNKYLNGVLSNPLDFSIDMENNTVEIDGEHFSVDGMEAKLILHYLYWVRVIGHEDWEDNYDRYADENGFADYFKIKDESFADPEIEVKREEFNRIGAANAFSKALRK